MLDLGIRLPLDDLLDLESCCPDVARHFVRTEKEEIDGDSLPSPLIQMNGLVADVESEQ
jgi:hypothetical protein